MTEGRTDTLFDTLRAVETPEGVALQLHLAGPVPRAAALAIDLLVRGLLYALLSPLAALSGVGIGLMLLAFFLLEWFYPVFFELRSGATPGKRALGLRVVHDDGTPVGPAASLLRNLLRVVDFLPFGYALGLICMLIDRDFQRLGDLAAGTLVVHRVPAPGAVALPPGPARPPERALERSMDLATAQAILDFAERLPRLSHARAEELAELLADGRRGTAAVEHLLAVARWLAGAALTPATAPAAAPARAASPARSGWQDDA